MKNNKEFKLNHRGNNVQRNNKSKNIWQKAFSRENGTNPLAIYNIRFCDQCEKRFKSKESLRLHVKSVHEGKMFSCVQCEKSYGNNDNLKRHIGSVHEGVMYKCDICGKDFKHKSVLKIHTENKHKGITFSCPHDNCEKSYGKNDNLRKHIESAHDNVVYSCDKCDKIYSHMQRLQSHNESVHEGKMFSCEQCEKSFSRKDNLKVHIEGNHGDQKYICEKCKQVFAANSSLKRHNETKLDCKNETKYHKNRKFYIKAEVNSVKLEIKKEMAKEIHNADTINEGHEYYNCESCLKSFSRRDNLKKHIHTVHEGHKDYHCQSCGKSYFHARSLKKHIRQVHKNENISIAKFQIKNELAHNANTVDEGEKDHKCSFCDKSYFHAHSLKKHIRNVHENENSSESKIQIKNELAHNAAGEIRIDTVHEGEKFHKCSVCGKSFAQSKNLKRHISIVHEIGEKNHKCSFCDNSYFHERSLKKHIRNVHESKKNSETKIQIKEELADNTGEKLHEDEKVHKCSVCGKSFSQSKNLQRHIWIVHEKRKRHKCDICGKSFTQAYHMRSHISGFHKGKKNQKCEFCSIEISNESSLRRHIKEMHENQKDYKCDSCGKSFARSNRLKHHIYSVHDGQKEHKCESCGEAFSIQQILQRHINSVHNGGKRDHKCDSCGKVFIAPSKLKRHINAVHSGLTNSIQSIIDKCMSNYTTFDIQNQMGQTHLTKDEIKQEMVHDDFTNSNPEEDAEYNKENDNEKTLIFQETELENSSTGSLGIHVSCSVCHVEMEGTKSLICHLKEKHNINPASKLQFNENNSKKLEKNTLDFKGIRVPCHICHKEFDSKSLTRHLRDQHNQGPQKDKKIKEEVNEENEISENNTSSLEMDSKIDKQGLQNDLLRYNPQRSKLDSLKNVKNIEFVIKEEIRDENDITNGENASLVGMGLQIKDHNNLNMTNDEVDPIITDTNEIDSSKIILPKSVPIIAQEDEISVSEFKPFPCGFCYDIYTEENELRKHIDTAHHHGDKI